ncbi:MAG: zinc metallopeptidase [Clostridia bacterium]|nr:zinc metallopeptidase [Clostridia bacterium]
MFFYWDWTYLLIIPGLLLGLWAQHKVRSTYAEYSRVGTRLGQPASKVVNDLLHRNGNRAVSIGQVSGELTDHYNPASETLNLSQGVYGSASIAALGIAAHEAGHAMQKHDGYMPLKLRTAIVPAVNICSSLSTPLFFLGLLFAWEPLTTIGILLFAASTVFALVTLPVEFDASRRAVNMLADGGYVTGEEVRGVRKVLNAAALTYVAAAVTSLLSLLRLVLLARRRRD